ncbi:hypothetical protein TgHK011_006927 [Trichoderma gracile]|nr:hypothetical protein TgHK011_006927 [Trichoderma gracile]
MLADSLAESQLLFAPFISPSQSQATACDERPVLIPPPDPTVIYSALRKTVQDRRMMAQLLLVSHRWPILDDATNNLAPTWRRAAPDNARSRLVVLQVPAPLDPGRTMHTTHHIRGAEVLSSAPPNGYSRGHGIS